MSDTDSPVYTVNDFCRAKRISRSLLYSLWRQGRGPRYFLAGARRRITEQPRQEWRQQLEAETAKDGDQ